MKPYPWFGPIVHDDHVRVELARQSHRRFSVVSFANYGKVEVEGEVDGLSVVDCSPVK